MKLVLQKDKQVLLKKKITQRRREPEDVKEKEKIDT